MWVKHEGVGRDDTASRAVGPRVTDGLPEFRVGSGSCVLDQRLALGESHFDRVGASAQAFAGLFYVTARAGTTAERPTSDVPSPRAPRPVARSKRPWSDRAAPRSGAPPSLSSRSVCRARDCPEVSVRAPVACLSRPMSPHHVVHKPDRNPHTVRSARLSDVRHAGL